MKSSIFKSTSLVKYTVLALIVVILAIVFQSINSSFLSLDSLKNIMDSMSFVGTIAVGMSLLLIAGEVDLAAGMEATFGGIIAGFLIQAGVAWPIAALAAIVFGAALGAINAFFVCKLNFMGFIVTIAFTGIYTGLIKVITSSKPVLISDKSFWIIGNTKIFNIFPVPFLIMVALMIIYATILNFTNLGRNIYLLGGNRRAARLCGIDQKKTVAFLYINNGALAALAGVVLAARMHSASPFAGTDGAIDAITAAVLGGVSFLGGVGGMGGCFIGILLLTVFGVGLTTTGLQSYWQIVAQGALLVFALSIDFFSENARRRSLSQKESSESTTVISKIISKKT